jgi:hypothetical protein
VCLSCSDDFCRNTSRTLSRERIPQLKNAGKPFICRKDSPRNGAKCYQLTDGCSKPSPLERLTCMGRDRQLLIQSDTGVYRFEDETFKEWIRTGQFGK